MAEVKCQPLFQTTESVPFVVQVPVTGIVSDHTHKSPVLSTIQASPGTPVVGRSPTVGTLPLMAMPVPGGPVAPSGPSGPVGPAGPWIPCDPAGPGFPCGPCDPCAPDGP